MFPTGKRILLLHLAGQVIRTAADHPFFVAGQGWTAASDLHVGDRLRTDDGQAVPIDAISESSQQAVVPMQPGVPPFPWTGLMPAGAVAWAGVRADCLQPSEPFLYCQLPSLASPPRQAHRVRAIDKSWSKSNN